MKIQSLAYQIFIVAAILVALYIGKDLLVPFVIAVVVWYLLNSLADLFSKIRLRKKPVSRTLQLSLALVLLVVVTFFLSRLVISNYLVFSDTYPVYQQNFNTMLTELSSEFDIKLIEAEMAQNIDIPVLLKEAVNSSLGFLTTFFLVLLYVVFLLAEQRLFPSKIKLLFKSRSDYVKFLDISKKIDASIHLYVSVKIAMCLLAGIASYIVLLILDVDFAVLWAVLIFLLNFIPIIGSLIGVGFPALLALLQHGTWIEPVLVLSLLTTIQVIIGNILEPKILGTRLNLSPLVVILSLTFWGALWGMAGMFLCVPITVIIMIVCNQFEQTRPIAILLSGGNKA